MNTIKNQTGLLDGWIDGLMDAGALANNPTIQLSNYPWSDPCPSVVKISSNCMVPAKA